MPPPYNFTRFDWERKETRIAKETKSDKKDIVATQININTLCYVGKPKGILQMLWERGFYIEFNGNIGKIKDCKMYTIKLILNNT